MEKQVHVDGSVEHEPVQSRSRRIAVVAALAAAGVAASIAVVACGPKASSAATEAVGKSQQATPAAPAAADDMLSGMQSDFASQLDITFPADAVADGIAARDANIQATLKSRPEVQLRETDGSSLSIGGGQRGSAREGNEVTASLTVYPSDGTGRLAIDAVAPGAHEVQRGDGAGACGLWVRDQTDPRGSGAVRLVAAMCPGGMLEVIAASPAGVPAIDAEAVAAIADTPLG